VLSVHDPSAVLQKVLKKKNHGVAALFNLHPNQPHKCQTGFTLSVTPNALRPVKDDPATGQPMSALDVFTNDLIEVSACGGGGAVACLPVCGHVVASGLQ